MIELLITKRIKELSRELECNIIISSRKKGAHFIKLCSLHKTKSLPKEMTYIIEGGVY